MTGQDVRPVEAARVPQARGEFRTRHAGCRVRDRPKPSRAATVVLALGGVVAAAACAGGGGSGTSVPRTATSRAVADVAPEAEAPPGTSGASSKLALWDAGRPRLRGVNIHQARGFEQGTLFDGTMESHYRQSDFDELAALGANYVNVSHPGLFDERPPYRFDDAMAANLDRVLEMIERADMFAVISYRTGPGRSELTFIRGELHLPDPFFSEDDLDESVWDSAAAQDAWVAMWRRTAERYRDHPIVVGYDVMVEPNSNEVVGERDGEVDAWDPDAFAGRYAGTLADWNGLYPRIVAAIREVDCDTPLLVGGNGYSAAEWLSGLVPVDDPATVYTVHQYAPYDYTHQARGEDLVYQASYDSAYLERVLAPVGAFADEHDAPVAVNEMGVVRYAPAAGAFLADQLDLFEERGWNWALWQLPAADYPGGDSFDFRLNPDLVNVLTRHWERNESRPSTFSSGGSAC